MSLVILAVLTDAGCVEACLNAAVAAAEVDSDAAIRALHVEVDPDRIVAASEEIEIQRMRDAQEGSAEDRAADIRAAFDRWAARHSPMSSTYDRVVGRGRGDVTREGGGR